MKKTTVLILIIITFFSCERDDICIDATTPKLIVRFYDNTDIETLKSVESLKIEIDSLGTFVEINPIANDSIIIPLRIDEDFTKIRLSTTSNDVTKIDDFTLNYTRKEVFVSRSCGFKTTFLEIPEVTNLTTNWVTSLTINNQNITDETAKHISIFH